MAPECAEGRIDLDSFERYLRTYLQKGTLNTYDIENAGRFFFYFLAVCNFYGQYYQSLTRNRAVFLRQAKLCKGIFLWLDAHMEELDLRLKHIAQTERGI